MKCQPSAPKLTGMYTVYVSLKRVHTCYIIRVLYCSYTLTSYIADGGNQQPWEILTEVPPEDHGNTAEWV